MPIRLAGISVVASLLMGCAGVFGFDGTSGSAGWHANGTLIRPSVLEPEGDGYVIPPPWRERQSGFGSDELVDVIVRASRSVANLHSGATAAVGDLSRAKGGSSAEHKSHQSGRDFDLFFYAVNSGGRSETPGSVMIHFNKTGRAARWSPPQGTPAPRAPLPDARFDVVRNWAFVRALLRDPGVEVQWIFVQRDLAAQMLRRGAAQGDDLALLARASQIMRQPSDSEPHDDHMHVRIYCDPADRSLGCIDRGPERWWKKRWKYMQPPFGHPPNADVRPALRNLLRTRQPVVVRQPNVTS